MRTETLFLVYKYFFLIKRGLQFNVIEACFYCDVGKNDTYDLLRDGVVWVFALDGVTGEDEEGLRKRIIAIKVVRN